MMRCSIVKRCSAFRVDPGRELQLTADKNGNAAPSKAMIRPSIRSGNLSPGQRALHVLNRLAFGPQPGDIDYVKELGVEDWIEKQLSPDSIPEPADLQQRIASLQTLHMTPEELFIRYQVPQRRLALGQDKNAARQESR